MAWKYVSFDLNGLQNCATRYKQYSQEMVQIRNDLDKALSDLSDTYWVGRASMKFRNQIGTDWLKKVDRYCELLDDLTVIMDDAVRTYDKILQEARRLKINA